MTSGDAAAATIVAVCLLALLVVIVEALTAESRRRKRSAVATQRNEVAARLRRRRQKSAAQGRVTSATARRNSPPPPRATTRPENGESLPQSFPPAPNIDPTPSPHPRIVTRTGPDSGNDLEDPFAKYGERAFTPAEDTELIRHYVAGRTVAGIAVAMRLDTKQIAARLIRLLFSADGRLDTDDDATRARRRYAKWEIERMRQAYSAGVPLEAIAAQLGRSQLGVGWRMLDLHLPTVPDHVRGRLLP